MPEASKFTPRVFSGIKPSGGLTLGNYLGAIKRFVDWQDAGSHETIFCVVDLHAITVWQDPAELHSATREVAAGFIASGISRTSSTCSRPFSIVAQVTRTWSASWKRRSKLRAAMP